MIFAYALLGLALLALALLAMRWFAQADATAIATAVRWVAVILCMVLAAWLAATGRAGAAVLPLALGALVLFRLRRSAAGRGGPPRRIARQEEEKDVDMTADEAREILGVEPEADAGEIDAAYDRLMAAENADRKSRTFIAARAARARELLLGETRRRRRESG